MSIDTATVAKIAHLARLNLPPEEQQTTAGELSKILDWIAQLAEVNTDAIEPLTSVNDQALRWREDKVTDGDKPEAILANAPSKTADFFTVPKVIE